MNKEKTVKFLWISMWATLILMVVLKLTFNYYYPIIIENSKLLEISKYIDDHKWLDYPLRFIIYSINGIFLSLCLLHEKWFRKKWHFIFILISNMITFIFQYINVWLGFAVILIPYILVPFIISTKPKKWIFITFVLDNVFQILSNFARGNGFIIQNTFFVELFMQIDYYLMFIIYYIGGCYMGTMTWLPWFTKKETVINAKIEKLEKKIKKLEEQKECLKKQ